MFYIFGVVRIYKYLADLLQKKITASMKKYLQPDKKKITFSRVDKKGSVNTGGPELTRKSLTQFPLPRFLAYVRVSGGISISRGPQYSPTNTNFM